MEKPMYLLGWTYDQWAIAFAVIEPQDDTFKSAIKVRLEWLRRYGSAPGGVDFVGIKRETNEGAVVKLFSYPYWGAAA